MSDLVPLLQRFFTDKLDRHLNASIHTKAAYADTFWLLLTYTEQATGIAPSALTLADLDGDLIGGLLQHLETERGNSVATRNARRAALRSFFTYASYRAPDTTTWLGRRDRLLLHLGIQTGLRVSELVCLRVSDIQIGPHSQLECLGKGRKQRVIPLQKNTVNLMAAWLVELPSEREGHLFPTNSSTARAAIGKHVIRHVQAAVERCPSLAGKNVTPHTLRHTCAMSLLHARIDTASIVLWLGHANIQTTQIYRHADVELKRRTL